jgi:hypothetical protein
MEALLLMRLERIVGESGVGEFHPSFEAMLE